MRTVWPVIVSLVLPLSCWAQLSEKSMMKIRMNNVVSGLDAQQVMTVYRMGSRYGRVEQQGDKPGSVGGIVIVQEPHIWVVDPAEGTGRHSLDSGPEGKFVMPIVPVDGLRDLEVGKEFDFFENRDGVRKTAVKKRDKAYDRYSLVVEGITLVMVAERGKRKPHRISVLYDGRTVVDYMYLEYAAGLKPDMGLFRPAPTLKIIEMAPEGLEDKGSPFPLARAIAREFPGSENMTQLMQKWSAFQHEPYDVSGVCHLTLPFEYETAGGGNTNEANAFAFLISNSLDWYPDCYCARHAYFVFKRTGKDIIDAGKTLNQSLMVKLARRWNATHVISGKLIHGKDGYQAKINVFDNNGRSVYTKSYDRPREYFELLGDVCVGIMRHLDYEPLPALVAHLKMKRCRHPQSIVDLGKAAFAEERSEYEFGLYDTILKRDPDFADVRYWWANQRYWKDRDRAKYRRDMDLSLKSYLVEAPVADRMPRDARVLAQVKKLVGNESPLVALMELRNRLATSSLTSELVERSLRSAGKYPNNRSLLMKLVDIFEMRGGGLADCDMIISLVLSSIENRYMTGSAAQTRYAVWGMAEAMMTLGYPEEAAMMYQWNLSTATGPDDLDSAVQNARELGEAMKRMGLLSDAYQVHLRAIQMTEDRASRARHAGRACVLAAIMGEVEKVAALQAKHKAELAGSPWLPIANSYVNIINKQAIDPEVHKILERDGYRQRDALLVLAQSDIAAKKERYREKVDQYMALFPDDREMWIMCDAYNQLKEGKGSPWFYSSLSLLHGHDPWVRDAVLRYRKRGGKDAVADLKQLAVWLADCEPIRWPTLAKGRGRKVIADKRIPVGTVAVAVDALLKQGKKEEARQLVLKYQYYAANLAPNWVHSVRQFALRARCNHLYHLIEQAKESPGQGLGPSRGQAALGNRANDQESAGEDAGAGKG